ncbi:unnamed protein product [Phytophthora lilii]|uniref:Unnamed protein product n=1 Tax=Phytophthora lilii TaxID=2077276 RepID=A0A9W7DAI8_9STRA|nr:unnamed protein product [Phytophthora lilii]
MLNSYEGIDKKKLKSFPKNPHFKLPLRCVVASPSGSGKSNTILYMISLLNRCFTKIIVCTKENEPLYDHLKDTIDSVEIFENAQIPSIKDYDNDTSKLIIFDDLVLEGRKVQSQIGDFYIRGRKAGFSMCYLSQVYYGIPKTIRVNAQYCILGRNLTKKDLNMIVREYEGDLDRDELIRIYKRATSEPLNTLMIDMIGRKVYHNLINYVCDL